MKHSKFAAAVNCMDGRVQLPVIEYIKGKYGIDFVDMITEPGPVQFLADETASRQQSSIDERLTVSVEAHGSEMIFVGAHDGCNGNPQEPDFQKRQIESAVKLLSGRFRRQLIIGIWIDSEGLVSEQCRSEAKVGTL